MKQFGLSKNERIKKKKEISRVFYTGKRVYSNSRKLKAIFCFGEENSSVVKVAFAIHKKAGNAVWRNKLKRLLRVAYRLNKKKLTSVINDKTLLIVISSNTINKKEYPNLSLHDVEKDVIQILDKIQNNISIRFIK